MRTSRLLPALLVPALAAAAAAQGSKLLTGAAALGGWRTDAPGVRRHLEAKDMAAPAAERRPRGGRHPEQGARSFRVRRRPCPRPRPASR